MPYEIQPTGLLLTLFDTFSKVGGRIDYILIGDLSPEDFANPYTLHKAAASFTIEAAITRYPRSPEKGPISRREPEKALGTQITPTEFFAPGYIEVLFEKHAGIANEKRVELEHSEIHGMLFPGEPGPYRSNYHFAFSYPPYSRYILRDLDEGAAEWLFPAMNQQLFGDDLNALTIYRWSTDWADYFNDGHEWWGSFLWTAYSPRTKMLIGMTASAS